MCFSDGESIFLTQLKSKDDSDNVLSSIQGYRGIIFIHGDQCLLIMKVLLFFGT